MKNKGITLIALVITIIILLILAGITISQFTGSSLFENSKLAQEKYENSQGKEEKILQEYENIINGDYTLESSRESLKESSLISPFTPQITEDGGIYLVAKANVIESEKNNIKGYMYLANGKVVGVSENDTYTYYNLSKNTNYDISVIAIDTNKNVKISNSLSKKTANVAKSRYIIVDVCDHLGSNCAVLNEVEIYSNSVLCPYEILNVYDSSTQGNPHYWSVTQVWEKTNLYDGQTGYAEQNGTVFLYCDSNQTLNNPNSGMWARFIIDLGSMKEISNMRISIGNSVLRTPKSVSTYILPNMYYEGTNGISPTYNKNILNRNNDNLQLTHTEELSEDVTTETWYNFI